MDPVPAVGSVAGSSPFDDIMPWAGMKRVSQDGNELVAIPKYWVKVSHNPFKVQISSQPEAGFQVSPAHRDREDGKGERDVVYIGRYECDSSYKSRSGQAPKVSTNLATFRSGIHALGAEYWQADFALQLTWLFLYIVEYADWNGAGIIGYGISNANAKVNTGKTDSMTYHTGHAAGTDGQTTVQYRGIENPWGNVFEWRDGIIISNANICTYNSPASFSSSYNATGAKARSGKLPTTGNKIKALGYDTEDTSFIYPSETTSMTGYVSASYSSPGSTVVALCVSGSYYNGIGFSAPFSFFSFNAPSSGDAKIGSRIQKLPNAV